MKRPVYVSNAFFSLSLLLSLPLISLSVTPAAWGSDAKSEIMEPHVRPDNMNAMFERGMLHGKVEAAFLFNDSLSMFEIDTSIQQHTAVLEGTVSGELEKDLATQVALNVDGIDEVENRLTVNDELSRIESDQELKDASADVASEARIITAIESKYAVNGHLSGMGINVNANGNKVILSGTVVSPLHKQLAELVAVNTQGVLSVDNRIRIDPED